MGYLFGRDRGHNLSKITEPLIDEAGTNWFPAVALPPAELSKCPGARREYDGYESLAQTPKAVN